MKKQEQDKIKKLLQDIKDVSDRVNQLTAIGEIKDIKKIGNAAHITMGNKFVNRKALVIILPN